MDCGLEVLFSWTISPAGGRLGSLSCKFIRTVERLRPVCGDCRLRERELVEERLECSCWRLALTAAAACSEVDVEREDGDGVWLRMVAASVEVVMVLGRMGDGESGVDLEGGREFRSGAMVRLRLYDWWPFGPTI